MPYQSNERVEQVAAGLIEKHHPHLVGTKIAYLMNTGPSPAKAPRLGKKRKLGSAHRVPEKYETLTGFDFLIEIKKDRWDLLDLEHQEALLDHELCHCGRDVDGAYIKDHDVTEFAEIIVRHGFWQRDLENFYQVSKGIAEQKSLFPDPPDAPIRATINVAEKHLFADPPKGPIINIDLDKACSECGKEGPTADGLCLKCMTKRIKVQDRRTESGTRKSKHSYVS
jgi:hypothetical protein